jgi:hypothetical protein
LLQQIDKRSDLSLHAMWMDGQQGPEAIYVLNK